MRLEAIRDEIHQLAVSEPSGRFRRWGLSWGVLDVGLRADQAALTRELLESYGDAIRLSVGSKPFPADRALSHLERRIEERRAQAPVEPEVVEFEGLEGTVLELTDRSVVSGRDGSGRVSLRNLGLEVIRFGTGRPLVGSIINPMTAEVVGGYDGGIAGTGRGIDLQPGESDELDLIFGTAAASTAFGYAVTPGRYLVRTVVPIEEPGAARRIIQVPARRG